MAEVMKHSFKLPVGEDTIGDVEGFSVGLSVGFDVRGVFDGTSEGGLEIGASEGIDDVGAIVF